MSANVRISADKTTIETSPAIEAELAAQFVREPAMVLDELLSPDLLNKLSSILDTATFEPDVVEGLGTRKLETPARAGNLLSFLVTREPLCRWLTAATGSRPIALGRGVVTQLQAGQDHGLRWHSDAGKAARILGVTINLGSAPYEGGLFEMRRRHSDEVIYRHQHSKPGSGLVFAIAKDLVHRINPVTAGGPRTVFSGWFLSSAD